MDNYEPPPSSEKDLYDETQVGVIIRALNRRTRDCALDDRWDEARRIARVTDGLLWALREYEKKP